MLHDMTILGGNLGKRTYLQGFWAAVSREGMNQRLCQKPRLCRQQAGSSGSADQALPRSERGHRQRSILPVLEGLQHQDTHPITCAVQASCTEDTHHQCCVLQTPERVGIRRGVQVARIHPKAACSS